MPDWKSTLVAGAIGAILLWAIGQASEENSGSLLLGGFLVGAGVQIGVRLTGVS